LENEGIEHAIIPDNAGAYIMSKGLVDLVIVGADRVASNGDVANKIGTLEKAIVAQHYSVPFYVAVPFSTFDLKCPSGDFIIIEERDVAEVMYQTGPDGNGIIRQIGVVNPGSGALNPAFDITPAGLITGLITSQGIIPANTESISKLTMPWN
jgi:methylthioribose-1-phosphate isomerase